MAKGIYTLRVDNQVVAEVENVITNSGMEVIKNYLAGSMRSWAGSISVGALNNSAASVNDKQLEFELSRVPVSISSVDGNEIVLNATLTSELECKIYELGVYPLAQNTKSQGFDDKVITTFSEAWDDLSGNPLSSANYAGTEEDPEGRSGFKNMIVGNSGISAKLNVGINTSGYSKLDTVSILYHVVSTGSNRVVTITFSDDQLPTAGTKSYSFTLDCSTTGYKVATTYLGNFTEQNSFNGTASDLIVTSSAASGGLAHLDSIKFNNADETNLDYALVSRALIGTAGSDTSSDYIIKPSGVDMDVEYRVQFTGGNA